MWFTSASLSQDDIDRFEAIQLFTYGRAQDSLPEGLVPRQDDSFSWFDLVILESPYDTTPRVENGVSLVWHSHSNFRREVDWVGGNHGKRFDLQEEDDPDVRKRAEAVKGSLKAGNVIGVRICTQYPGWENHAKVGQLIVRISNKAPAVEQTQLPDVSESVSAMAKVQEMAKTYYDSIGYSSETVAAISSETRADIVLESPPAYNEPTPLRLLSLDGGGVRGVSELCILKRLMQDIARSQGRETPQKPCEYFDMIAGTSTGGLIALMLGRLEMSIEECEAAYDTISKSVFGSKHWKSVAFNETSAFFTYGHMYEEKPLEDAVKKIVKERLGDAEEFLWEKNPRCRVLVMSTLASATSDAKTSVHLRSYNVGKTRPSAYKNFKIWEAARATSAAPVYFKKFTKDGKDFVDGGMGHNNPVFELVAELSTIYGTNFQIGALVSLGTGVPVLTQLRTAGITNVSDYIVAPTNSENPAETFKYTAKLLPKIGEEKYWRFNLDKASCAGYPVSYEDTMIKMDDWKAIERIRRLTNLWLEDKSREASLVACTSKLASFKQATAVPV